MDIQTAVAEIEQHPDFRLLRRVKLAQGHVFAENLSGEPCARLAVVDTETTGFRPEEGDRIIDLAIAVCEYGKASGQLYRIVDRFEGLEDPEQPISAEVVTLTGITDEMVKDHRIDDEQVAQVMTGVGLVICHNAAFDRGFLEARFAAFRDLAFGCSLNEVPWRSWGINSSKLDYLGFVFRLFHTGHRARADVDMLAALLAQQTPDGSTTVLSVLLESARLPSWRINAIGLPFDSSQIAKARGYRWHPGDASLAKCWWVETLNEQEEMQFLTQIGCHHPEVIKLTARERYRQRR